MRLIAFLIGVLVMTHFVACLWYFSARFNDFDYDTWVYRNNYLDKEKGYLYLVALYWSLTTLTTVGYGDINAVSETELVLCLIWMMFGVGTYSFIIGTLTSVLSNYDARQALIDKRIKFMDMYAKEQRLPVNLYSQINYHIQNRRDEAKIGFEEKRNFILTLPKEIRFNIAMEMHN
jgi:hyperpolarization activated cyclic nucleotide-gated potassium channel 1